MISKLTIGIVLSMILLSAFLANILNVLSIHALRTNKNVEEKYMQATDTSDHLIWFLQISDIHISVFRDPLRITQFKEFCDLTVNAIQPSVVLASGDLTDAKTSDAIGSQQLESEWKIYKDTLEITHMNEKTIWLDIRGNHDNFNVAGPNSKQNYFTNYSVQGRQHPRSYMQQIKKGSELYSFIGIDACLEPGPKRPFNFVGTLDDVELKELDKLTKYVNTTGSQYTVWFGHFPTSCILSPEGHNVRDIIGDVDGTLVYVCGHLHKLGGLVPKMYAMQQAGFLELELGDWKENRVYRLMAIDHGLLSFTDLQHGTWPVILITNPKAAIFFNPARENIKNIQTSTHIRILVFSLDKIESVTVRINGDKWMIANNVNGPLYVAKWDPMQYSSGLHRIQVAVKDEVGRTASETQDFSLDGTKISFGLFPRIALMANASAIFQGMFTCMVILTVIPLVIMKILHKLVLAEKINRPRLRGCGKLILRKIWILTSVHRVFWPMVLYPIYLVVGPWAVGYLVEDRIGVIFAWGIFVDGTFLPGSFTYAYGFIQLLTFQIPLVLILANILDKRFQLLYLNKATKTTFLQKFCLHLPFVLLITMQMVMAFLFWLAYGTLAFILGPLRTWSIILAILLYCQCRRLPEKALRDAANVWKPKTDSTPNIPNSTN